MKTSELTGAALDWAVAKCEGVTWTAFPGYTYQHGEGHYSTNWAQGGPIIEREKIQIKENGFGHWFAKIGKGNWMRGPTPLIAAMRCYVASKLGEDVSIPEELK